MTNELSRRSFLLQAGTGLSAAWISANWPALLSAATHAGLATFAVDDQKTYREGLPELQARVGEMFPGTAKFSGLKPEQQDEVLHSFDENAPATHRPRRASPGAQNFFETVRQHTIAGFLVDPDYGGNHDGVGWKVIGREREHMFAAPFGYYDKDYPGWQPAALEAEKK